MRKSTDTMLLRGLRRKVFQSWEGGRRTRGIMYLATVRWAMAKPSFSSSPWLRGAPHNGLARLMLRIKSMVSGERVLENAPGALNQTELLFHCFTHVYEYEAVALSQ